jgi:hypothetical protein
MPNSAAAAAAAACRSQHIFVDPDTPRDDYKLTYNCLACPDNPKTYNDGYHIIHHANSRLHWSELPAAFVQQLELHDTKDGECWCFLYATSSASNCGSALMSNSRLHWSELPAAFVQQLELHDTKDGEGMWCTAAEFTQGMLQVVQCVVAVCPPGASPRLQLGLQDWYSR